MSTSDFWLWFEANSDRLLLAPPSAVVELVTGALSKISDGITVEVFTPSHGDARVLIFTSHGDVDKFDRVASLVRRSPELGSWKFYALKPPRGFEFSVKGREALSIRDWRFIPLKASAEFDRIAIRIEMPAHALALMDNAVLHEIVE